jgi:hypothetical protein
MIIKLLFFISQLNKQMKGFYNPYTAPYLLGTVVMGREILR